MLTSQTCGLALSDLSTACMTTVDDGTSHWSWRSLDSGIAGLQMPEKISFGSVTKTQLSQVPVSQYLTCLAQGKALISSWLWGTGGIDWSKSNSRDIPIKNSTSK